MRRLNVADGKEIAPPAKFMPPNGKPYALSLVNNVIYTHTAQGCGGNPNMVYTYDLATDKVGSWGPAGGGMWGRTGPAISSKGVMYTGTGDGPWDPENGIYGNGIIGVKQNPQTKAVELVDYYGPSNAEWLFKRDLDMQVTPAIFNYKGKELMVDAGKECVVYLMDTESIGGDDHRTPLHRTPLICNEEVNFASAGIWGSMASWEDAKGTRWVLTPFWGPKHSKFKAPIEYGPVKYGAIAAFKVEEKSGQVDTGAGLDLARHESRRTAGDRQRHHLRLRQRRKHRSGERSTSGSPTTTTRRIASKARRTRALRAGRADRQRTVVERRSDHVVEPLGRAVDGQRPGLHQHLRRHAVLLRHQERSRPDSIRSEGEPVMRRLAAIVVAIVVVCAVWAGDARAQGRDWMTTNGDAQRSSWIRSDAKISRSSCKSRASSFCGR